MITHTVFFTFLLGLAVWFAMGYVLAMVTARIDRGRIDRDDLMIGVVFAPLGPFMLIPLLGRKRIPNGKGKTDGA